MLGVREPMTIAIGRRLRELRMSKQLSQDQVGRIVGVEGSTISLYETDTRMPPYDILVSLAIVYSTSTDYILGLDNRRSIVVSGLTELEIEAITTLVTLMTEKNRLINRT